MISCLNKFMSNGQLIHDACSSMACRLQKNLFEHIDPDQLEQLMPQRITVIAIRATAATLSLAKAIAEGASEWKRRGTPVAAWR